MFIMNLIYYDYQLIIKYTQCKQHHNICGYKIRVDLFVFTLFG